MAITQDTLQINPFEKAYTELKSDPNFSEQSWETAKRRDQLDNYVGILYAAKKEGITFEKSNYGFDYDMSRYSNELFSDREELKPREFTKIVTNENGEPKEEIETVEMTDYDYNKKMLQDYSSYKDKSQQQLIDIEQKEARQNFWTSMAAGLGEFGVGVLQNLEFLDLIMSPIDALIEGKSYKEAVQSGIFGQISDDLRHQLDKFETEQTHLRDIDGNYTTAGKLIGSSLNSIGKMMPMVVTRMVPGLNAFAGISQAAYYGSMYQSEVRQMFNDSKFENVDTFAIISNAALKTAIEFGTEMISNVLTGGAGTYIDNAVFGRGTGAKMGLSKLAIFGKVATDAATEGFEEVAANIFNNLLDTAFSSLVDSSFAPNMYDISFEGLMDAFVMGALTSYVMTGGSMVVSKRVNVNGQKLSKSQSWAYNMNTQNLLQSWNKLIEGQATKFASLKNIVNKVSPVQFTTQRNLTIVEARANLKSVQQGLQIFADLHQSMGDTRFAKAMTILQSNQQRLMNYSPEEISKFAKIDMNKYFEATPEGQKIEAVKELKEKVINAITESEAVKEVKIGKIVTDTGKYEAYTVKDNILYIDDKYISSNNSNKILKGLAEREIIKLLDTNLSTDIKKQIIDMYREFKGDTFTNEEAFINLMYNVEFSSFIVSQIQDFNKLIEKLALLFEEQVKLKNYKTNSVYYAIFENAINKIKNNLELGNVKQTKEILTSNVDKVSNKFKQSTKTEKSKKFQYNFNAEAKQQTYEGTDNILAQIIGNNIVGTKKFLTPADYKNNIKIEQITELFQKFFSPNVAISSLKQMMFEIYNGKSALFNQYMSDNKIYSPLEAMNKLLKDSKFNYVIIAHNNDLKLVTITDISKVFKVAPNIDANETLMAYLKRAGVSIKYDNVKVDNLVKQGISRIKARYMSRYILLSDLFTPAISKKLNITDQTLVIQNTNDLVTDQELSKFIIDSYVTYDDYTSNAKVKSNLTVNKSNKNSFTITQPSNSNMSVLLHEIAHVFEIASAIQHGGNSYTTTQITQRNTKLTNFVKQQFPKSFELTQNITGFMNDYEIAGYLLYKGLSGEMWANGLAFTDFSNINKGFDLYFDKTSITIEFLPTGEKFVTKSSEPGFLNLFKSMTYNLERYEGVDQRYISKKSSNEKLEYLRNERGNLKIDPRIKAFWTDADLGKLNTELVTMLTSGEFKTDAYSKLIRYFNSADKMSTYEFNLFKKHLFPDSVFKTRAELDMFLSSEMFDLHVIDKLYRQVASLLKKVNDLYEISDDQDFIDDEINKIKTKYPYFTKEFAELLGQFERTDTLSKNERTELIKQLKQLPELKVQFDNAQKFLQVGERYSMQDFSTSVFDFRATAMRNFEGSLLSANKVYNQYYGAEARPGESQLSQLGSINKDGNEKAFEIEDTTSVDLYGEDLRDVIRNELINYAGYQIEQGTRSKEDVQNWLTRQLDYLKNRSDEQLPKFYDLLVQRGYTGRSANVEAVEQKITDSDTRQLQSVRSNITSLKNRIDLQGMNKRKFDKLTKQEQNLFERNNRNKYVLKKEFYYMFTTDEDRSKYNSQVKSEEPSQLRQAEITRNNYKKRLAETETLLRSVLEKIKKPVKQVIVEAASKSSVKKLESEIKTLQQELIKKPKTKTETVLISEATFKISSQQNIPDKFRKLFETTFSKFHKSKTKFIGEGVITERISINEFREQNSDLLNTFTKKEIVEVLDFFESGMLWDGTISASDLNRLDAFRLLTLAHFKLNPELYNFDNDISKRIEKIAQQSVSGSARELSLWNNLFSSYDPAKLIMNSLESQYNVIVKKEDIADLVQAIEKSDSKAIAEETNKLTQLVMDKRQTKNFKNFLNKLMSFRYMAMLSSPATSARNFTSNILIKSVNDLSDFLTSLIFKGKSRKGQITLTGPISDKTKAFVNEKFAFKRKHGVIGKVVQKGEFIDLLSNANKLRYETGKTSAQNINQMLVNKVMSDIYGDTTFSSAALNKAKDFINFMLSDDRFIRQSAAKYMAQMIEQNKVDVSKYDSDFKTKQQITQFLVDAAALSYHDYMRSDNMFSFLEAQIRNKSETAYYVYKMLFPFAKSSWNFTKELFRLSPFGLTKSLIDLVRLDNKIAKVENDYKYQNTNMPPQFTEFLVKRNIGKGIVGSLMFGIGAIIAAFTDFISFDDDELVIKIGNVTFDISNITGTSALLAGAGFIKMLQDDASAITIVNSITDQYTQELFFMNVLNNWRYSSGNLSDFSVRQLNSFLSSFIPNALKQFNASLYNHKIQYSTGSIGFIERFSANLIPGLAYALPKQINIYTGEAQLEYDVPFILDAINAISPVKISAYTPSDLEYKAMELGIKKIPLTGKYTINGKEFKGNVNSINQLYGRLNKQQLQLLTTNKTKSRVQMPDGTFKELYWSQMTDVQRKNAYTNIMDTNSGFAKIYAWTTSGHRYYTSEAEYTKLLRSGITKNVYRGSQGFVE